MGHLSNEDCARVAAHAESVGVKFLALGHLSEENNTPKLARDTVAAALGGADTVLTVCDRCAPTRIM